MHPGEGPSYSPQQPQQQPHTAQQDGFTVAWRGYDRDEVHRYLNDKEQTVRQIASQRDAARSRAEELSRRLEHSQTQVKDLSKKVDQLCKPPLQAHDLSERLDRMLRLANDEAAEIKHKAEEEASDLRGNYERKIAELDKQQKQNTDEHRKAMATAKQEHEKLTAEAKRERDRLAAESQQRIKQAETDSKAKIEREESASAQQITKERTASKTEAERLVREATETAKLRVDEAGKEIDRLRTLRGKLAGQLSDVLQRIQQSGSLLEPLPEERAKPGADKQAADKPSDDKTAKPGAAKPAIKDGGKGDADATPTTKVKPVSPPKVDQPAATDNGDKSDDATTEPAEEQSANGKSDGSRRKTKTFAPVTPQ